MSRRARAARKEVRFYLSANFDGCEKQHYISVGHSLLTSPHFQALRPTTRLVYLSLADWAAGRSAVQMSHGTASKVYGFSPSSFDDAIAELRRAGFIAERADDDVLQFKTAEYTFSAEWKSRPPPVKHKRKSKSAPEIREGQE